MIRRRGIRRQSRGKIMGRTKGSCVEKEEEKRKRNRG
jgi:hypothetical protein